MHQLEMASAQYREVCIASINLSGCSKSCWDCYGQLIGFNPQSVTLGVLSVGIIFWEQKIERSVVGWQISPVQTKCSGGLRCW